MILYEYPFNEKIRTYLRLEKLFMRFTELSKRASSVDHHFALITLFEIMDVGARADLKSDVLKDLDKQRFIFNGYRGNPAISEEALEDVLRDLNSSFQNVNDLPGKVGNYLSENDWLMSIRSRIGIPGGTCEFDLPAFYAWQQNTSESRQSDLHSWIHGLLPLTKSIYLLLHVLRDSGQYQKVVANHGVFQQNLPQTKSFQLARVQLEKGIVEIPEISGNRLLLSIRLMHLSSDGRLRPSKEERTFELALCA